MGERAREVVVGGRERSGGRGGDGRKKKKGREEWTTVTRKNGRCHDTGRVLIGAKT